MMPCYMPCSTSEVRMLVMPPCWYALSLTHSLTHSEADAPHELVEKTMMKNPQKQMGQDGTSL